MTLEEAQEFVEAEKRYSELRAKHGATEETAVKPTLTLPQTQEERLKTLEDRVRSLEGSIHEAVRKLFAEWQMIQDKLRVEVHRLRQVVVVDPRTTERLAASNLDEFGDCVFCGQRIRRIAGESNWEHQDLNHAHPHFITAPKVAEGTNGHG